MSAFLHYPKGRASSHEQAEQYPNHGFLHSILGPTKTTKTRFAAITFFPYFAIFVFADCSTSLFCLQFSGFQF